MMLWVVIRTSKSISFKIGMIVRDRGASETVGKILHRVLGDERAERIMSELGIGTPQPVSQE